MNFVRQHLIDKAVVLLDYAKRAGADHADVVVVRSCCYSVSVYLGEVEGTEASESADFSLRVFVGQGVASVSATLESDSEMLAMRAVCMAKVSPSNPFEDLADSSLLVRKVKKLDLFDSFQPDSRRLTEDALETESAGLDVPGVTNSGGADASYTNVSLVLVTSNGFCKDYLSSRFVRSCSVVAGEGMSMERDYDCTATVHFSDMDSCKNLGRKAGERAVRRLGARQMKTGMIDVIFDHRVASGIAGHLAAMVNGAAVVRKTSLLGSSMGKRIMKAGVNVFDNPLRQRGLYSRPFDDEGVEGVPLYIVKDGVLRNWLLSSSVARELNLRTNGRGVRSSLSVLPSCTNFTIEPGSISTQDMISGVSSGLYVTELFGPGVDLITGQYSRGASGFCIEGGVLTSPVNEVTLASNLLHMLSHMIPADDLDRCYGVASPTLLIEGMMLAGK
ncbi:MAG: PmbA protein [Candidatus Tokpelaia sp. JSC161]|jgi:PmbA protein|nr:MAG: PmbA protein [Candidatus Tokpelaia sp. JSC161]